MGKVNGIIAKKPANAKIKGYPFRMFFYFPKIKKYDLESELSIEEEKIYNHRYKAIKKLLPVINKYA
jgi:inosine/xanthosine triphosphate pyrophosphatase family protein